MLVLVRKKRSKADKIVSQRSKWVNILLKKYKEKNILRNPLSVNPTLWNSDRSLNFNGHPKFFCTPYSSTLVFREDYFRSKRLSSSLPVGSFPFMYFVFLSSPPCMYVYIFFMFGVNPSLLWLSARWYGVVSEKDLDDSGERSMGGLTKVLSITVTRFKGWQKMRIRCTGCLL